jgi:hypothetical protein
MVLAATNKPKGLLYLAFIGKVRAGELEKRREEVFRLLEDLPAGFRLLSDLSSLECMDTACQAEVSRTMELLDEKGVSLVVRVIPEPHKDIGFGILAAFHYGPHVRSISCSTMEEAAKALSL